MLKRKKKLSMSYHVYQTSGFILRSVPVGEADRVVFVLTEHLGLLPLSVRAARKISSKLRYALKNYSFVRVAFVRGKNAWRLTDAEEKACFHAAHDTERLKTFAGISAMVSRLVHGEGENRALFAVLADSFHFLREETLSEEERRTLEVLSMCKVLSVLGYAPGNPALAPFLSAETSRTLLDEFASYRKVAAEEVARALKESHL